MKACSWSGAARPLVLLSLAAGAGCAGGCSDSSGDASDRFAAVDEAARSAFEAQGIDGMGLVIYDRDGVEVFERMYGDFSPDRRVAIASASKLISGVTIFELVGEGYLSLDSTTGQVLGWQGDKAAISLRGLLSFTSGLPPEHACTYKSTVTLADCVTTISSMDLVAAPGTRFDYGSTHLAVAGRMAEVATGRDWNDLFAAALRDPLGLPSDIVYYANPLNATGTDNPLLAGGLRMSMNEYERVLHFVFDKGSWQGQQLLDPAVFEVQAVAPYPEAEIGRSPAGGNARYGLTAWLECDTPATGCSRISSPGVFGFTPWLDRDAGYYAILGMEAPNNRATHFGAKLEHELQPLIEAALKQ